MATRSAGSLIHKVAFDLRPSLSGDDDATPDTGNPLGAWEEQFQCRAGFINLTGKNSGTEAIMADRLQGQHTQIIFIRRSMVARLVTTDWRLRDARSGISYSIRDVSYTEDRMWVDFLCQSGTADG